MVNRKHNTFKELGHKLEKLGKSMQNPHTRMETILTLSRECGLTLVVTREKEGKEVVPN